MEIDELVKGRTKIQASWWQLVNGSMLVASHNEYILYHHFKV